MSGDPTVLKQQSSDFWREPMRLHRTVLAADVYGLKNRDLLAYPAGAYQSNGAAWFRARAWVAGLSADADVGEVMRLRAYTFPPFAGSPSAVAPDATDQAKEQGAGIMIADVSVSCGGNVFGLKHPVTGAATPGLRWYEMNDLDTEHYNLDSDQFKIDPPAGGYRGITAVDEVQTITLTASGTADWTCSFRGATTAAIAYDADGAAVTSALEALATVGAGNVVVTGAAGGPWVCTFGKDLGNQNVPMIVIEDDGGHTSIIPVETTPGVSGRQLEFRIDLMADIALWFDVCSLDGSGNATQAAVSLKRVS